MDVTARTAAVLGAIGITAMLCSALAPTAAAAQLTCDAVPGTAVTVGDGVGMCSATAEPGSRSFASTTDGVAYAGARSGALTAGLGLDGGVGAAESVGGFGAALAFGAGAVSIVSPDPGAVVIAISGTAAQASVGTAAEGVVCRGLALAINFSTGQLCLSDGVSRIDLPVPSERAVSSEQP